MFSLEHRKLAKYDRSAYFNARGRVGSARCSRCIAREETEAGCKDSLDVTVDLLARHRREQQREITVAHASNASAAERLAPAPTPTARTSALAR